MVLYEQEEENCRCRRSFTEEQIVAALRQAEAGMKVADVCRKVGVSQQSFYRWKSKYWGSG